MCFPFSIFFIVFASYGGCHFMPICISRLLINDNLSQYTYKPSLRSRTTISSKIDERQIIIPSRYICTMFVTNGLSEVNYNNEQCHITTGTFYGIWRDSEHFHVIPGNYSCNNMTFFTFKYPRYCMKNFQQ
jgi:hypothetical protein